MTEEDRKSSKKGIWLCQSCAKLIDSDPDFYSIEKLNEWEKIAESKSAFVLEHPSEVGIIDNNEECEKDFCRNERWFASREKHTPFMWHYGEIDKLCKVENGSVILVSGYTGVGTDMFVQNIVRHNLKSDSRVIYFNLRESSNTIVNALVAAESYV